MLKGATMSVNISTPPKVAERKPPVSHHGRGWEELMRLLRAYHVCK
jgi:hypothetical protein